MEPFVTNRSLLLTLGLLCCLLGGCTANDPRHIYEIDPRYEVHAVIETRFVHREPRYFAYSNLPGDRDLSDECLKSYTPFLSENQGPIGMKLSLSQCIDRRFNDEISGSRKSIGATARPFLESFVHLLPLGEDKPGQIADLDITFTPENQRVQLRAPILRSDDQTNILEFYFQTESNEQAIDLDLGRAITTSLHELTHLLIRLGHLDEYQDEVREEFAINLLIRCVRVSAGLPVGHETSVTGGRNDISLEQAIELYESGQWEAQSVYPGNIAKPLSRQYLLEASDNGSSPSGFEAACQSALVARTFDDALGRFR